MLSQISATRTLIVGAGGFLGASSRYLIGGIVYNYLPATFPYATLIINVSGCFFIGLLGAMAEERAVLGPTSRLFWMVGVLGGYTTYSTFGYETTSLVRESSYLPAGLYVIGHLVAGLGAVWAGAFVARWLL
ncbi:MAG: fluoride efflux transporter CrcB [Acidobacteria bacterium]|nr:fluoride efflux transporter CrcB [Acidobacteriota bacterium]